MNIDSQIRSVGVALADLLVNVVVLVLGTGHAHIHTIRSQEIAAGQRHLQVDVLLYDVADRAGIAAAVTNTNEYLFLAHGVFLLLLPFETYYAADRTAVRSLFLRGEQIAVRCAVHARRAARVLHKQQVDRVPSGCIARYLVLRAAV